MLAAMRLVLVRHAEAAPGEPDELRALTSEGREQARVLAAELARERPDAVLTSPLLRARQTADAIARAAGYTWGIGRMVQYFGLMAHWQGDPKAARTLYEESLATARQVGAGQRMTSVPRTSPLEQSTGGEVPFRHR